MFSLSNLTIYFLTNNHSNSNGAYANVGRRSKHIWMMSFLV